ncbi:class A beta-lactamase [Paractinoplanes maris]|uniref:class A beta-lactamase n=1 Tax=Paractinoplanes maris TaxID=1734446 RepID=UPI0020218214|nr:class A beta-lactamase [Actinoplanes maris]
MTSATRRPAVLALPLVLAAALLSGCGAEVTTTAPPPSSPASMSAVAESTPTNPQFSAIERRFSARLGVYAIDTGTGRLITHRADERFAHASTFKALLAAVVLRRLPDTDRRRVVKYTEADLLEYAPITSKHVATGMSIDALIDAAVRYSDNTAANLLLDEIGGPQGLQRQLRAIKDRTTNADRNEPALNEATPGDTRDTSTPRALGTDLRAFVLGDLLPPARRQKLTDLLIGNTTGGPYIRAGVPAGWKVGDKTGSGGYGTRNDIAVVWPPTGSPLVIAIQSDRGVADAPSADALIAEATKVVVATVR